MSLEDRFDELVIGAIQKQQNLQCCFGDIIEIKQRFEKILDLAEEVAKPRTDMQAMLGLLVGSVGFAISCSINRTDDRTRAFTNEEIEDLLHRMTLDDIETFLSKLGLSMLEVGPKA